MVLKKKPERVCVEELFDPPLSFATSIEFAKAAFDVAMQSHGFHPLDGETEVKREGPRGTGDTFVVTYRRRYQGNGDRIL